jgi:hypothetical protein
VTGFLEAGKDFLRNSTGRCNRVGVMVDAVRLGFCNCAARFREGLTLGIKMTWLCNKKVDYLSLDQRRDLFFVEL